MLRKMVVITAVLALFGVPPADAQIVEATVAVHGMACPFCAYGLEKRLRRVEGVGRVEIDMRSGTATLRTEGSGSLAVDRVPEAVRRAGFTTGAMEVVATGRVGAAADGGWRFELGEDGQELLLVNLSGELAGRIAALAGSATRVRIGGELHLHSDAPPGVEPSALEELE